MQIVHNIPPLLLAERRRVGRHLVVAFGDFPKKLAVALPPEIRKISGARLCQSNVTGGTLADVNGLASLDRSRGGADRFSFAAARAGALYSSTAATGTATILALIVRRLFPFPV
jgi:hypothetical protein